MKVYCKRTFIGDGNDIKWSRDKYYETLIPERYEMENGVYMYVKVNNHTLVSAVPFSKSKFDKYFIDIKEIRNGKIDQILE